MDINHKDKPENTFEISKTQFYCKITSLSKKHTLWTVTFSIKAKIDNKLKIMIAYIFKIEARNE